MLKSDVSDLISSIINIEWDMFSHVQNVGGKARCQSMPETFFTMRSSQFKTWSENTLSSYYSDLLHAINSHRNLVSEKYARMMEYTYPDEYIKLKDFLEPISDSKKQLIVELIRIQDEWDNNNFATYPYLRAKGRPKSNDEQTTATTAHIYMLGEYATYSQKTLEALLNDFKEAQLNDINLARQQLENTVLAYGYKSLEQAEKQAKHEASKK